MLTLLTWGGRFNLSEVPSTGSPWGQIPETQSPAPYTLHRTPYTLHPQRYTLINSQP